MYWLGSSSYGTWIGSLPTEFEKLALETSGADLLVLYGELIGLLSYIHVRIYTYR